MVETAVEPVGLRMTFGTVGRVAQLDMLGSVVVLHLVATDTLGFGRGKVPLVAGRTLCDCFMAPLQLEAGGKVVESRRFPSHRGMARGTLFWDARGNVARKHRLCVARCVATVAGGGRPRKSGRMTS